MKMKDEKRKKLFLSARDVSTVKNLFVKILIPFIVVIIISSILLFLGMRLLLQKANFLNYGIAPSTVLYSVSQFISIYTIIFLINIILMLSLSAIIFYFMVHDLVFPLMRLTNELKTDDTKPVQVRNTDVLLLPIVKIINKLIEGKK